MTEMNDELGRLVASAGQVLIGPVGRRITCGAVLVMNGRIAAVGERERVVSLAPAGTPHLNLKDCTILPGLIDCHVHLAFDAGRDPVASLDSLGSDRDAELLSLMTERARRLLFSGVTTVRDLGDLRRLTIPLRDAIAAGRAPGPRILAATTPLTSPGGHCGFLGGEVQGEEAIRDLVRANADAGADLIKVMVTGGHLTPTGPSMEESQFTAAELRLIVDEAHARGLPVAAHAHGTDGIIDALNAGVDTIEHCTWLHPTGFKMPTEILDRLATSGIAVCPAVGHNWRGYAERFGPEITDLLLGRLRHLEDHGVRLCAGTDAGIPGERFGGLVDALEAFQHVGLERERVIELATVDSAAAMGIADTTGTLAEGMDADILVVRGDPLSDLNALRDVRLVVARGRLIHVPARTP